MNDSSRVEVRQDFYFAMIPEWVLDSGISPSAIAVYLNLARFSNNPGRTCYPSKSLLAELSGLHPNTITKCLHELRDVGAVTIQTRTNKGFQTSNLYTLHMTVPHGADQAPTKNVPPPPTKNVPPPPTIFGEVTRQEIQTYGTKQLSVNSVSSDSLFDEFWSVYPRKVGRGQATKSFRSAIGKAAFEDIIAGCRRYALEREGQDPKFTAHPATWLNGERWSDESTPAFLSEAEKRNKMVQDAITRINEQKAIGS